MANYNVKKFDEYYENLLNAISPSRNNGIPAIEKNKSLATLLENLDWESDSKNTIHNTILTIEKKCDYIYNNVNQLIIKTQIVYNQLYGNLLVLKEKIKEYNNEIETYENAVSRYNTLLANQENSEENG